MKPKNLLVVLLAFAAPIAICQTNEERKQAILQHQAKEPSVEAKARKDWAMARLKAEGVPILASLPVIEDSAEVALRTKEEIAHRAIAVFLTAVKAEGLDQAKLDALAKKFGAEKFFTPNEAGFFKEPKPSDKDRTQFSWRYEDLWVLLWSLGYVEKLDRPDAECDVPKAVAFLRDGDTAKFIANAKLRPIKEVLDEADLIYRYHWATDEARLKKSPAPAKLDAGVVVERHYALNWLIGYLGQAWDEISTDT